MKRMELLAPAGNMEKLKIAFLYGADAAYLGGTSFSLRAFSDNFTPEEMKEAVDYAHSLGKKIYVTVNIFSSGKDYKELPGYLRYLEKIKADAVLIADPGIFRLCREVAPALPIHVSTQANTTNWSAVQFWKECGAERVVLAREVSLADAKEISANVDIELEGFVHGAMCISYSGRCLLSNYFTRDRDSNHGECVQCCRFKYSLVEEKRPGEYFPVMEDERGTYIFNSKDLCMLRHLPDLYDAGFASLKVEGRMKSLHYVATVVKVYREAMDAYEADPEHFTAKEEWVEELEKISHRPYTTGFYYGRPAAAPEGGGASAPGGGGEAGELQRLRSSSREGQWHAVSRPHPSQKRAERRGAEALLRRSLKDGGAVQCRRADGERACDPPREEASFQDGYLRRGLLYRLSLGRAKRHLRGAGSEVEYQGSPIGSFRPIRSEGI